MANSVCDDVDFSPLFGHPTSFKLSQCNENDENSCYKYGQLEPYSFLLTMKVRRLTNFDRSPVSNLSRDDYIGKTYIYTIADLSISGHIMYFVDQWSYNCKAFKYVIFFLSPNIEDRYDRRSHVSSSVL